MKKKRKMKVEEQQENVQSGSDENAKKQDDSTEITKKRIRIENNNYGGITGEKREMKDEEQPEGNVQCHVDENNEGQENYTEETRKIRKIQTPNTSDCEINDNIDTDPQPEVNLSQDETLILKCDWLECEYNGTNMDSFSEHVSLHLPNVETRSRGEIQEVFFCCLWYLCNFDTQDKNEITRHILYHSYHTTLKCVGENVLRHTQLPKCNRKRNTRNKLPRLPSELKCCWTDCLFSCAINQMFFDHVDGHVKQQQSGEEISCSWSFCRNKFTTINELVEHVRIHTQEKTLACPNCGSMSESSLKFIKHMILPVSEPEEVLNVFCLSCQVTLPSLLEAWRHLLNVHPSIYKCTHCKYKGRTEWGFKMHRRSHMSGKRFPDDDCATVDPHTLHPIIPFDDGFEWAIGIDPVMEDAPGRAGLTTTVSSISRSVWAKLTTRFCNNL